MANLTTRDPQPLQGTARLRRSRRLGIYAVGAGLWLTGGLWLLFHYLLRRPGELGVAPHPLEPWWLTLHGAFAFASLWALGLLWGVHVVEGWALGKRRPSGVMLLAALGLLIVTGYLLYYVGDAPARDVTGVVHWGVGLACPAVFFVHRFTRRALGARRRVREDARTA